MATYYATQLNFKTWCKMLHDKILETGGQVLNAYNITTELEVNRNEKWCVYQLAGSGLDKPTFALCYYYDTLTSQAMIACRPMRSYNKATGQFVLPTNHFHVVYYSLVLEITANLQINTRRFVFNTQQNQINGEMYCGYFLPLSKPEYYQYPFLVTSSHYISTNNGNYSYTLRSHDENSNFLNFYDNGAELCNPANEWLVLNNNRLSNHFDINSTQNIVNKQTAAGSSRGTESTYFLHVDNTLRYTFNNVNLYSNISVTPYILGALDGVLVAWGICENNAISQIQDNRRFKLFTQGKVSTKYWAMHWEL